MDSRPFNELLHRFYIMKAKVMILIFNYSETESSNISKDKTLDFVTAL